MFGRLADPPFTWQMNHADQLRRIAKRSRQLEPVNSPDALRDAQSVSEVAISVHSEDAILYQQLSEVKQAAGDYAGSQAAAEQSLDLLPSNAEVWLLYGLALAQQREYEKAADAFRQVFTLNPVDVWGRQNLAICLRKMGRRDAAIRRISQQALKIKPRALAWGWLWSGADLRGVRADQQGGRLLSKSSGQSDSSGGGIDDLGPLFTVPALVRRRRHKLFRGY